jgi:hypothetical protein
MSIALQTYHADGTTSRDLPPTTRQQPGHQQIFAHRRMRMPNAECRILLLMLSANCPC